MELWIRSQDRFSLLKPFDLELMPCLKVPTSDYDTTDIRAYLSKSEDDYVILGTYATKERALEILDDIEDKLINCTFAKKQNGLGEVLDFMPNSIYVYTMPKE